MSKNEWKPPVLSEGQLAIPDIVTEAFPVESVVLGPLATISGPTPPTGPTMFGGGGLNLENAPSGYLFLDGAWRDPKQEKLVQVLRNGNLIRRRPVDLLPYDELVQA